MSSPAEALYRTRHFGSYHKIRRNGLGSVLEAARGGGRLVEEVIDSTGDFRATGVLRLEPRAASLEWEV
jgi:hypothetical protein